MDNARDVIIIGSGPAGLTAAVYTARANLSPLVIEGLSAGGQLMMTTEVENYPGFRNGIMGPDLMAEMRAQAERFGADIVTGDVASVDLSSRPFRVTADEGTYLAKALIIATGASARLLGLPSERALMGRGVSTCATCDGFFFRGQEIAVVGGGDSAIEEASFLTKFASKVHLLVRRNELRASKIMQERAHANEKIEIMWNTVVDDLVGTDKLEGAIIRDTQTGATSTLPVTGLFVAIGHRPNTDLFKGVLDMEDNGYLITQAGSSYTNIDGDTKVDSIQVRNVLTDEVTTLPVTGVFVAIGHRPNTDLFTGVLDTDENGYLVTQPGSSYTNIDGVFACGDVQDHTYRQAITAAGSGCMAAIDCERWLEANHH